MSSAQTYSFYEIEIRFRHKGECKFTNNSFYVFFFALEVSKTWFDKIYDLNIDV